MILSVPSAGPPPGVRLEDYSPPCGCRRWEVRRRVRVNGVVYVDRQCLACGVGLGGVKKKDFDVDALPGWDAALRESFLDARRERMGAYQAPGRRRGGRGTTAT